MLASLCAIAQEVTKPLERGVFFFRFVPIHFTDNGLLKAGFIFKGDHIYQDKDVEKNYEAHLDWLKQTSE